jgi:hypothetical protein
MNKMLWMVVAMALATGSLHAQDEPRVETSIGYSFLRLGGRGGFSQNGGNISVAGNVNSWLGIVGDLGGYHSSPFGASLNTFTYLAGPRISLRRDRVTPFAQVLFGGARVTAGAFGFSASTNAFAVSAGAGFDLRISRHVALRPQLDYFNFRSAGQSGNGGRASVGIVYRLGRR